MQKTSYKIIGLSGTNGSGKDSLANYLVSQYNYYFVSVSDLLRQEVQNRGLPPDRQSLRQVSSEWRRQFGLGVLIDKAVSNFKQQTENYSGLVIASLRNPGEADRVHELNGSVIWLDADPKLRYDRIQANKAARNNRQSDNISFEQFLEEEKAEMFSQGDEATLSMNAVKQKADWFIDNSFKTFKEFADYISRQPYW